MEWTTSRFSKLAEERMTSELPEFVKLVTRPDCEQITTTLQPFKGDTMLLFMAIWYATAKGKTISFKTLKGTQNIEHWHLQPEIQ